MFKTEKSKQTGEIQKKRIEKIQVNHPRTYHRFAAIITMIDKQLVVEKQQKSSTNHHAYGINADQFRRAVGMSRDDARNLRLGGSHYPDTCYARAIRFIISLIDDPKQSQQFRDALLLAHYLDASTTQE